MLTSRIFSCKVRSWYSFCIYTLLYIYIYLYIHVTYVYVFDVTPFCARLILFPFYHAQMHADWLDSITSAKQRVCIQRTYSISQQLFTFHLMPLYIEVVFDVTFCRHRRWSRRNARGIRQACVQIWKGYVNIKKDLHSFVNDLLQEIYAYASESMWKTENIKSNFKKPAKICFCGECMCVETRMNYRNGWFA